MRVHINGADDGGAAIAVMACASELLGLDSDPELLIRSGIALSAIIGARNKDPVEIVGYLSRFWPIQCSFSSKRAPAIVALNDKSFAAVLSNGRVFRSKTPGRFVCALERQSSRLQSFRSLPEAYAYANMLPPGFLSVWSWDHGKAFLVGSAYELINLDQERAKQLQEVVRPNVPVTMYVDLDMDSMA